MRKILIFTTILLIVMTSCDSFLMSGKVIDDVNGEPIADAEIKTSEGITIYSDSLGNFKGTIYGSSPRSDKLEALVFKEGYETKYFDLSKEDNRSGKILNLTPGDRPLVEKYPSSLVKTLYLFNLIFVNLLVLFTLFFVLFKKVNKKWIWVLFILIVNISFGINYINGHIDVNFIHLPFYIKHHVFYPFTIKVPFVLATIAFWVVYFTKRDFLFKNTNNDDKNISN